MSELPDFNAARRDRIEVNQWSDTGVELRNCGTKGKLTLVAEGARWEKPLILHVAPEASEISVPESLAHDVELRFAESDQRVTLSGAAQYDTLRSTGGVLRLERRGVKVNALYLTNTTLTRGNSRIDPSIAASILSIEGANHFAGSVRMEATTTVLGTGGEPSLSADEGTDVSLGEIQSSVPNLHDASPWIRSLRIGPGEFEIRKVQSSIEEIRLDGACLSFSSPIRAGGSFSVTGYGRLVLSERSSLVETTFRPAENLQLTLEVGERATVTGEGRVTLGSVGRAARIASYTDGVLSVDGIGTLDRAELSEVDLSGLPLSDLEELRHAEKIAIWIPRRRAISVEKEASEGNWRDPPQQLEQGTKARIAHRWLRLAELSIEKNSSGSLQSRARYAAMHWRRKSLPWRWGNLREKFILLAYWALGYGERIARPLITFGCIAVVAASFQVSWMSLRPAPAFQELLSHWGTLAIAPLSLLRVIAGPDGGTAEPLVVPLARLVGIVCITLSLLAARRLARAD